jgi:sugar-specific transcriptional regulator TrmB
MIVTVVTTNLNDYEWRAYRALLGADSLTAYELGKRSGVPLSRCYEVARSLAAKGFALVQPGETPRYRAVEPDEVVARERRALEELGDELRALRAERDRVSAEPVWTVHGREPILARAAMLIERAARQVTLHVPPESVELLGASLAAARRRGVAVDTHAAEALLLVVDGREALLGELSLATHITQPSVVALLADQTASTGWLAWEEQKVRRLIPSPDGRGWPKAG